MNSPQPHPSAADILIVDDTPDNLRLLSVMLTENGYKVRKAINGERALQAVKAIAPDIILLDIRMPDMSGYEVCRHLKESEYRDIPVIFISALDDVFDKVMAFDVGGIDYINKPFQGQEVLARIDTHLKITKLQRQLQLQNTQLQQEVGDRMAAETALKTLNQELERRVCDRTAELQSANEQLRTLETQLRQQLNVFLNAVSHDLRNPVIGTSMVLSQLSSQLSSQGGETIELPRAILDRMMQSNDRQLRLIDSLIETHAAEVWGINLNCQPIRLHELVQSAIADLQPLLEREHAALTTLIAPTLPLVNADPLQLSRVYQNLIANALKHNPVGLAIALNAELQENWVRCTVHDNGMGIEPEQQSQLFDLYFQGNQKRKSVGLGLGLYLCKQIIQAHGGSIGVESQPEQGSTFWFTLPINNL